MNLIFTADTNEAPLWRKGCCLTVTDQRHGQKVIGCYPDVTSKLVELVVSLSVESEELQKVKKRKKKIPWVFWLLCAVWMCITSSRTCFLHGLDQIKVIHHESVHTSLDLQQLQPSLRENGTIGHKLLKLFMNVGLYCCLKYIRGIIF